MNTLNLKIVLEFICNESNLPKWINSAIKITYNDTFMTLRNVVLVLSEVYSY